MKRGRAAIGVARAVTSVGIALPPRRRLGTEPVPFSAETLPRERSAPTFGAQDEPSRLARLEVQEVVVGDKALGLDGDGVREPVGLEDHRVTTRDRLGAGDEAERVVAHRWQTAGKTVGGREMSPVAQIAERRRHDVVPRAARSGRRR